MSKLKIIISCIAIAVILVSAGIYIRKNTLDNRIVMALQEGGENLRRIEKQKNDTGAFPNSFKTSNVRYVKAQEDADSYYIMVPVKYSRESVIYYHGPLYKKSGWYFKESNIQHK